MQTSLQGLSGGYLVAEVIRFPCFSSILTQGDIKRYGKALHSHPAYAGQMNFSHDGVSPLHVSALTVEGLLVAGEKLELSFILTGYIPVATTDMERHPAS